MTDVDPQHRRRPRGGRSPPARRPRSRSPQAHLDRIAAVDGEVHAFLHVDGERALAQAAVIDHRIAGRGEARPAGRRAARAQGHPHLPRRADHLRLEDPRGLAPAVRRHRHPAAAGRRPGHPRQDQPGRVRDGLLDRELRVRPDPQPVGHRPGSPAAPAAARPPRWPPSRRRWPSAPTPAARSASPPSVTGTVGVKPTYGGISRYGVVAWPPRLDQPGPCARTVLDAALLHEVIAGHDPLDSTSIDAPVPAGGRGRALR